MLFDTIIKPDDVDKQAQTPIPLEALRMGFASQEAFQEKNLQESKDAASNFFNLPAYGQDSQILSQAKQAFLDATKGVSTTNFADPQTASKINGIISQITSNPDVQAAVSRGTTYQRMQKEKEKAEAAGKEYMNLGLKDAQDYYNSGTYIRNKQFSDSGYIAKDMPKYSSEIEKTVPIRIDKNGNQYKDEGQMKTMMNQAIQSDPHALQQLKDQFQINSGNIDWNKGSSQKVSEDLNDAIEHINNADVRIRHLIAIGGSQDEINAVQAQKEYFTGKYNEYKDMHDNPYAPNAIRQKYENDYIKNQIDQFTKASIYHNESDPALKEQKEKALEHTYKMTEDAYKENQENYRKQLELSGQEGQLINDNGKLRVATPDEVTSGKSLPATKSNTLHIGGNPLAGDVKLEEIDNSINSKKVDYIQQLVDNSKLRSAGGYEYNKVEITPDGKIKLIADQYSKTKPDVTELTPTQFATLVSGKDSKSLNTIKEHYKQVNAGRNKEFSDIDPVAIREYAKNFYGGDTTKFSPEVLKYLKNKFPKK